LKKRWSGFYEDVFQLIPLLALHLSSGRKARWLDLNRSQ